MVFSTLDTTKEKIQMANLIGFIGAILLLVVGFLGTQLFPHFNVYWTIYLISGIVGIGIVPATFAVIDRK